MLRTVSITLIALALGAGAAAGPAGAQPGDDLYAPFPSPVPDRHASSFYEGLGATLTPSQLDRGRYLAGSTPVRPSAATGARAASVPSATDPDGLLPLGIVLLLAAGGTALIVRRRTGPAPHPS